MKLLKRMAVCLLAAAMALSMLTACDNGGDAPASSSNPPASSGSTDTGTKDPDPPASTEPTKPALPTTWAETRTNAYFTRLGVSAENVYEEYEGYVEGDLKSIKCATQNRKIYWDGTDVDSTDDSDKHVAYYADGAGNAYSVNYDIWYIQKYNDTDNAAWQRLDSIIRSYILIPEAADVATVSATEQYQYDGRYYYAESIKARVKVCGQTVTAEWDYLFDGDELKYVVVPESMGGSTLKVQKIEANPADSMFALPDWYSENVTASRTSQYFKSKGVLSDRYTIEVSVRQSATGDYTSNDYTENRLVTVDGQKVFFANTPSSDTSVGEFYRGELINGSNSEYYHIDYKGRYCWGPRTIDQSRANDLKTAGSAFIIPDASNTAYMTSGTEKVGLKTYYKESFYLRNSTNDSVIEFYFDGADGMELAYIKNGRQTTTIESISGTPRTDLLKLPEGFPQYP